MLRALVLAACLAPAAQEWVEISQQHYRKPPHRTGDLGVRRPDQDNDDLRLTFYPADEPLNQHVSIKPEKRPHEDQIEQNMPRFPNHSITEHNWNDKTGNRRVDKIKIRPNITPEFTLEIYGHVTESEDVTTDYNRPYDKDVFSATIERVPNKGSVKRVQLVNSPVKSPSVTNAGNVNRRNDFRRHGSTISDEDHSDEFDIKADIFRNTQAQAVTTISNENNIFTGTKDTTIWKHDRTSTSTGEPYMVFQKYPQSQRINNINKVKNNVGKNNTDVEKMKPVITTNKESIKEDIPSNSVVKNKINKLENIDLVQVTNTSKNGDFKNILKDQKQNPNKETGPKGENNRNENIKVNTMENVMKFVKVVADTISKNTKRGVNGKVKYLTELKETLLNSIKDRIDSTWPDDARVRRSPRGHVEFPSSESSLMTISFLTFAVFLIKLVLQVIQTYKNKAMMVAPLVVATAGRNLRNLRVRNLH